MMVDAANYILCTSEHTKLVHVDAHLRRIRTRSRRRCHKQQQQQQQPRHNHCNVMMKKALLRQPRDEVIKSISWPASKNFEVNLDVEVAEDVRCYFCRKRFWGFAYARDFCFFSSSPTNGKRQTHHRQHSQHIANNDDHDSGSSIDRVTMHHIHGRPPSSISTPPSW